MPDGPDPFRRQPQLRGKVADPECSFFRSDDVLEKIDRLLTEQGLPSDWRRSADEIEASRRATLGDRPGGDLWVFGYGSLIWDPGFRFDLLDYACAPAHARRMCLVDILGGRGTEEAPGLMAALDRGAGCDGVALRIPEALVEAETGYLWRREFVAPAYQPAFIETEVGGARIVALTFVADHASEMIDAGLGRAAQVRYAATGEGFLGTSLAYLENLVERLGAMGIEDRDLAALLDVVRAEAGRGTG